MAASARIRRAYRFTQPPTLRDEQRSGPEQPKRERRLQLGSGIDSALDPQQAAAAHAFDTPFAGGGIDDQLKVRLRRLRFPDYPPKANQRCGDEDANGRPLHGILPSETGVSYMPQKHTPLMFDR